jgi:hypothetical protein
MQLADLIEVKGMKAQGNQLTKLKVKEIVLTHPIDEGKESVNIDLEGMNLSGYAKQIEKICIDFYGDKFRINE